MKNNFTKRCENIEDIFIVYKKEIYALLQSVKDEVGKSNYKNFSQVITQFGNADIIKETFINE